MSSTHGNTISQEHYPTPVNAVKALLEMMVILPNDKFLEPCRAEGNIYNLINLPEGQKYWAELQVGVDYLTTSFPEMDIIITNPPFSLTCEFLEKSLSELSPTGTLVYLQRINFLGSNKRLLFWEKIGHPNKLPIIVPRPLFVKGTHTDSCEYAWFIYDRGNRFPLMKQGISSLKWNKTPL